MNLNTTKIRTNFQDYVINVTDGIPEKAIRNVLAHPEGPLHYWIHQNGSVARTLLNVDDKNGDIISISTDDGWKHFEFVGGNDDSAADIPSDVRARMNERISKYFENATFYEVQDLRKRGLI